MNNTFQHPDAWKTGFNHIQAIITQTKEITFKWKLSILNSKPIPYKIYFISPLLEFSSQNSYFPLILYDFKMLNSQEREESGMTDK